jgi:hypothetical protein
MSDTTAVAAWPRLNAMVVQMVLHDGDVVAKR